MSREEFFYLLPYLLSLALSLGILLYAWAHRQMRGARVYSWFMAGQTLTIAGFIFELISPNLATKLLWDKFQWLTDSFLVFIPFLLFSLQFSEHKLRNPRLTWGYWAGFPILFTLILLTDSIHHLIYPNPHLSTDYPFPELRYDFTIIVYLYALLYVYSANFYGIGLLFKRARQPHNTYRQQYWTIAIGFSIPLILSFFTLADIRITPQRDIAPFSIALGNIVVAWGLFRYRLFDIIPIARERIVENMKDPVVVLDSKNRVVDMNQAALTTLERDITEVIGKTSSEVFAKWPMIARELEYLDLERKEIAVEREDDLFFYDINVSSIRNNMRQLIGRIVVARDITKHKTLEAGYRILSEELEQRVRERTEELRNSAERYRAVVENQTEFIVSWKPDGTRLFANEAYCRYFGLTLEEALSTSFMPLIAEEDRPLVEEKMSRLISGEVRIETFMHRVIKPDGSIGWQEWTDQAIYDGSGQIIEFQSVGHDVTERRQAEQALRQSEERFSKAFQSSPIIITISLIDTGKLLEVNEAFEKTMGFSREEVIGKTATELGLWANPADREHIMQAFRADGKLKQEELQFRTKSGTIIICHYSAELIEISGSECILAIVEDITERKKAEASLADAYDTTLEGWAKALELRDKETEGHSRRVTETTVAVARAFGFDEEQLTHVRRGSILHDIGKMGIPDDILRKNGSLTDEEKVIVYKHPTTALNLLKPIAYLEKALDIPYCHHEKWDGSGYPCGLQGEAIPLAARIFAVVDVWDALSSDRPYRNAWPREKVADYLLTESGKHFDPQVVDVFMSMLEKGEI